MNTKDIARVKMTVESCMRSMINLLISALNLISFVSSSSQRSAGLSGWEFKFVIITHVMEKLKGEHPVKYCSTYALSLTMLYPFPLSTFLTAVIHGHASLVYM